MLGFGVYQIPEYEDAKKAVLAALKTGYRLIDTAQGYMNEAAVGAAIKESGIPREEIFITTKLWIQDFSYDGAIKAANLSMERLGVEYISALEAGLFFRDRSSDYYLQHTLHITGRNRYIIFSTIKEFIYDI